MKKIFLLVLAVAVVFSLPLTAQAKADFELGGYIRMDALWNSNTGAGHTLAGYLARENTQNYHGRLQMNANATRFNFLIKGPELWGSKVTGFIEVDFDGQPVLSPTAANSNAVGVVDSPFIQAKLRLRHAMMKMAWTDREIILGQFWSINNEMTPETADSGGFCAYGNTQLRVPQIRYTQKFGNGFDASVAVEEPVDGRWGLNVDNTSVGNRSEAETSEVPMIEAKVRFEQDLYGKAAWYGAPKGFYVGLGAAYLRTRNTANNWAAGNFMTLGQNAFVSTAANANTRMNYADHWLVVLENFAPIIPTATKNLGGTMSFYHQWWIGQGVSAWRLDYAGNDRYYNFKGRDAAAQNWYDLDFIKRWGGNVQLQYYWTNEIFTNVNAGLERAFNFNNGFNPLAPGNYNFGAPGTAAAPGYDPVKGTWRAGVTQWYRPISAVKFGLQYAFMRTEYFQITGGLGQKSATGNNHSIFTTGYFFF